MTTHAVRLLESPQTAQFDLEYVNDALWHTLEPVLAPLLSKPGSRCLDVGGGNGAFVDRLLKLFPTLHATVVEPAPNLLTKNHPHARKQLIQGTFQTAELNAAGAYDCIFFNWVLHHFVSDGYAGSLALQQQALAQCRHMLTPHGRVCMLENFYDGYVDDLPSRLIFSATASHMAKPIARLLGANTAGVGVCFHSEHAWIAMLEQAGFALQARQHCYDFGQLSPLKRLALGLKHSRVGLLVATAR